MRLRLIAMITVLGLAGCLLGPNYHRPPSTPIPVTWRDTARAIRDSSYANLQWWRVLGDTTLQGLVRGALMENRDLHIALARVNQARALLGVQRFESYPQIDVHSSIRRSNPADSSVSGLKQRTVVFIDAELNWELDLWGRLRRLDEAALATLLATEEERRAVIITVVSDVARAYLELRDLDAQVAITDAQVTIRRSSLDIAQARFRGGLTSELDVRQGETALALVEATQARVRRERTQKENELSVLLGRPPEAIPRGLPLTEQRFDDVIPAGLPSGLLVRRPDVRRAEEQLRAANARIGAAIAALFPTISLTGTMGTVSNELTDLFKTGTFFWRGAANLLQPVSNKDRNPFQAAAEWARTAEAVGLYEKTVLTAFQEVEDGLVAVHRLGEEASAASRAVAAARRSVFLADLRYQGGVDNYLNLLDSQREELNAELLESQLQRQRRVAVVQLYKALGGGWDPVTDTLALPPHGPPLPRRPR
jgi:outer membrane protein, multidrug efflux system